MEQRTMVGGFSQTAAVTEEIQKLVQKLKADIVTNMGCTPKIFHAIAYRSQMVAGTNYLVKVVVGDGDDYIHVAIFEPLPFSATEPEVTSVETMKRLDDDL
ncbi:stefin-C-like [Scyliorhinus torazame]|uniref:stefin-C-like n=1 Tax=Scyliorhinus torazame TaxID=75743 RepID=UPI003B5B7C3C